jgi:peptidyl-prolyl cis-trans isomerase SurA
MILRNFKLFFLCFVAAISIEAQQNSKILMVVNGDSISSEEFLKVYRKNLDLVQDESQKDIDNYIDLFVEYKLKLQEAKRLELDNDQSYLREFNNYKRQLIKSYMAESEVTTELMEEAYERMQWDVKAVHILIRLDENEQDTLATYNKVLALKPRLENENFNSLKKELHNGTTTFVEDLGYFSAFKMVYSFENKAYNTEVGTVSTPFRTRFGYHILKVLDKRPSRGTMTAAHIMIAHDQKDSSIVPEKRIRLIYQKLQQGESFESLAKQFSDDKGSAKKGGELRPFKSGELSSPEFEDAVFALKDNGDYTEPFETNFGWHIAKKINIESLKDYESMKTTLENRVKRDSRSKIINEALVTELKEKYVIYENPDAKDYFKSILGEAFFNNQFKLPSDFPSDQTLFSINEKAYSYKLFGDFLSNQQRNYYKKTIDLDVLYDAVYNNYFQQAIIKFREENLENENPEFAQVLQEYRDGLLLFDLMEKEIWNKAANDSTGLKAYYENHKSQYNWQDRVEVIVASSSNKKKLKELKKDQLTIENLESLKSEQEASGSDIIYTSGVFEKDSDFLPADLKYNLHTAIYNHNNTYHLIRVIRTLPAAQKSFEEAKGQVTSDYQAQIEADWIKDLKDRFPVVINEAVLNSLKSE